MDPKAFPEQYRIKAQEWAVADGEARKLEKMEKIVFSEIVNQSEGSISSREHAARANAAYKQAVSDALGARTKANILKAELDGMEMAWQTWRTLNATRRAEMGVQ